MTDCQRAWWTALALPVVCTCGFDPTGGQARSGDGDATPDAAAGDAHTVDAAATPSALHLLLTEVKTNPVTSEFIEIYNPTCEPVDLSTYYLADDARYGLLPSWGDAPPQLGHLDAVLKFPDGATLAPGAAAVVARSEPGFTTAYGGAPDFAVLSPTVAQGMVFIAHGDTRNVDLRNAGEAVTLFRWDGVGDLVADGDVVVAGDLPGDGDQVVSKQTIAPEGVDGPDGDDVATAYRADAATIPAALRRDAGITASSGAYQRIALEDGFEIELGGNGVGGHDETSEDTLMTWEQETGSVPTPGEVPDSLRVPCVGPGE